jgi:hypothetical protein
MLLVWLVALVVTAGAAGAATAGSAAPIGPAQAPSEHDAGEVGERADEILARDEFQPPGESVVQRFLRWLADRLDGGDPEPTVIQPSGEGSGGSAPLTLLFLVLVAGALLVAIRFLVRHPRRAVVDDAPEPAAEVHEHQSAQGWARDAARHEAAGRWKEGLRCRFRALVERLTERGIVPEVPGRTTGELRLDVRATAPDLAADFDRAAELFDRAWYGDLDTGPDEARRFAEHADAVLAGDRS